MSQNFSLDASPRELVGKKVKKLRRMGIVPAVIYGPEFETTHIAIDQKILRQVLLHAGGTHLIEVNVDGTSVTTLAREVQRDPVHGDILHVDFYRVAMDRTIRAEIPLSIVGDNPLIGRDAILIHPLTTVQVESLPGDLPAHINIDVSRLTEIGQHLSVSDLEVPEGVTILTNPEEMVAKLDYAQALPEEEEEVAVEEAGAEPEVIKKGKEEEEEEE